MEGGTEEDGVGDFDEAVVDAVGVDEGDAMRGEVGEDGWGGEVVGFLGERCAEGGV